MQTPLEQVLEAVAAGEVRPVYLVWGDRILAEPAARQLAEAIVATSGADLESVLRPAGLGDLLSDLKTYSLFGSGKVTLVLESSVLADKGAAASLIDESITVLPVDREGDELTARERAAANRLLQTFHLFRIDPTAGSVDSALQALPDWVLAGAPAKGRRARTKKKIAELRSGLAILLERARSEELEGTAASDIAELADALDRGLPERHSLVLCESHVAKDHPLVQSLRDTKALVKVGEVSREKSGDWSGLAAVRQQLEAETGVAIQPQALEELARRTLRRSDGGRNERVDEDSTARLAAEYRKMATFASSGDIDLDLVQQVVEDRGEEDVWGILDAISEGRPAQALTKISRYTAAADDPVAARLALFGLLAGLCHQLTVVTSLMEAQDVEPGIRNYSRFKSRLAPRLQAPSATGTNPIAGLHPYRLHRAYLAASRIGRERVDRLSWKVLRTEQRLKGESGSPRAALSELVVDLAR